MHNEGRGGSYTRRRLPVTLVFVETHPTVESATHRERQIALEQGEERSARLGRHRFAEAILRQSRQSAIRRLRVCGHYGDIYVRRFARRCHASQSSACPIVQDTFPKVVGQVFPQEVRHLFERHGLAWLSVDLLNKGVDESDHVHLAGRLGATPNDGKIEGAAIEAIEAGSAQPCSD